MGFEHIQRTGEGILLGGGKRNKGIHGSHVILYLLQGSHAGKYAQHIGQAGNPANGPAGQALFRGGLMQQGGGFRAKGVQHPAAHRLHNDDLQPGSGAQLVFFAALLIVPVKIIELQLYKIPIACSKDLCQLLSAAMERKAQPLDFARLAQLVQLVIGVVLDVIGPAAFMHRVNEVKIKVISAAVGQLLVKNTGHILIAFQQPAGQFAGKVIAGAGILGQSFAAELFAHAAVVGVGSIEIVHAVGIGIIKNLLCLFLVNAGLVSGVPQGQAHGAKTQQADFAVEVIIGGRVIAANTVFHTSYAPYSGFAR